MNYDNLLNAIDQLKRATGPAQRNYWVNSICYWNLATLEENPILKPAEKLAISAAQAVLIAEEEELHPLAMYEAHQFNEALSKAGTEFDADGPGFAGGAI
jgi:hypothetical protein